MFAASGGAVSDEKIYIEDVFSTYLYTGNFHYLTIDNGIDLAGKGGMVWTKSRTNSGTAARNNHFLIDSARGWSGSTGKYINSNTTSAADQTEVAFMDPTATGYMLGQATYGNESARPYVSWTFRKAPKFFDVVTYTGNGVAGRTVSHSLGTTPGMIIVKKTNTSSTVGWFVYHRSLGATEWLALNLTNASDSYSGAWNSTGPTNSVFTVGNDTDVNASGATYVAYVFAHDTTTDGLIQCGSFTTDGSGNASVNLGWEPQWMLSKASSGAEVNQWRILDNMRGMGVENSPQAVLSPNLTNAEQVSTGNWIPAVNSTGFTVKWDANTTFIYMAIRRGPMRTPTDGTKVFGTDASLNAGLHISGFPVDMSIAKQPDGANSWRVLDRLRGANNSNCLTLSTDSTSTESDEPYWELDRQNGVYFNLSAGLNYRDWMFRRAPSFFDVVCYTGTGSAMTVNHNLGVAPELMIVKSRSGGWNWFVYSSSLGATKRLNLNLTNGSADHQAWNNTAPTSTVFSVSDSTAPQVNESGGTYVAYLFASCPGVSKVGSYTGNGSSQTINCGFSAGARFILIKRTDSTGDWYVWDTARGIVSSTDPHLSLNTTAAEVTTDDTIDPDSTGFIVNQVAATNINVNAATYIYLAIA